MEKIVKEKELGYRKKAWKKDFCIVAEKTVWTCSESHQELSII